MSLPKVFLFINLLVAVAALHAIVITSVAWIAPISRNFLATGGLIIMFFIVDEDETQSSVMKSRCGIRYVKTPEDEFLVTACKMGFCILVGAVILCLLETHLHARDIYYYGQSRYNGEHADHWARLLLFIMLPICTLFTYAAELYGIKGVSVILINLTLVMVAASSYYNDGIAEGIYRLPQTNAIFTEKWLSLCAHYVMVATRHFLELMVEVIKVFTCFCSTLGGLNDCEL